MVQDCIISLLEQLNELILNRNIIQNRLPQALWPVRFHSTSFERSKSYLAQGCERTIQMGFATIKRPYFASYM